MQANLAFDYQDEILPLAHLSQACAGALYTQQRHNKGVSVRPAKFTNVTTRLDADELPQLVLVSRVRATARVPLDDSAIGGVSLSVIGHM